MQINRVSPHILDASNSGAPSSSSASAQAQSINQLGPGDFMTLLIAQIQAQDPTNPMDPTTFVNQLVSFNTLEQVMQINQTVSNYLNPTGTSSSSPTGPTTKTSSAPTN